MHRFKIDLTAVAMVALGAAVLQTGAGVAAAQAASGALLLDEGSPWRMFAHYLMISPFGHHMEQQKIQRRHPTVCASF